MPTSPDATGPAAARVDTVSELIRGWAAERPDLDT